MNITPEKRLELMVQLCAGLLAGKADTYLEKIEAGTYEVRLVEVQRYYEDGSSEQVPEVVGHANNILIDIEREIEVHFKKGKIS